MSNSVNSRWSAAYPGECLVENGGRNGAAGIPLVALVAAVVGRFALVALLPWWGPGGALVAGLPATW